MKELFKECSEECSNEGNAVLHPYHPISFYFMILFHLFIPRCKLIAHVQMKYSTAQQYRIM